MKSLTFTVLGKPEPQGSVRAFMVGGKPRLTTDNSKLKPWRQQVGWEALRVRGGDDVMAGKHIPVSVDYMFLIAPPQKARISPAVKPDIDKLIRACNDALSGILWADDGQIVQVSGRKMYGLPARTTITVTLL